MKISYSSYNDRSGKVSSSFHRTGPKFGTCRLCGHKVPWNAYSMAAHLKGKKHEAARRALVPKAPLLKLGQ